MFCRMTLEIFNMGVAWALTNQDRCPNKWEQEDTPSRHMFSQDYVPIPSLIQRVNSRS